MLKVSMYLRVVSAPVLLATVGCTISFRNPATLASSNPESMMAIARALERQGHADQAKVAYSRVIAIQPNHPGAQSSLETLIAKDEQRKQQLRETNGNPAPTQSLFAAQSTRFKTDQTQTVSVTQSSGDPKQVNSAANPPAAPQVQYSRSQRTIMYQQRIMSPSQTANVPAKPVQYPVQDPVPTAAYPNPTQQSIEARQAGQPSPLPPEYQPALTEPGIHEFQQTSGPTEGEEVPGVFRIQSSSTNPIQVPPANDDRSVLKFQHAWSVSMHSSIRTMRPAVQQVAHSPCSDVPILPSPADQCPMVIAAEDSFVPPLVSNEPVCERQTIDCRQIEDVALRPYFESFHVGLVKQLRAERESHQWRLVGLVADHKIDSLIRSRATFLLGEIGPEAIATLPLLQHELCNESDRYMQADLAEAVIKICPSDECAICALLGCLKESDSKLQMIAAFALHNVDSEKRLDVIDSLKVLLRSNDSRLQRQTLLTLAEFGPASASAIPEIEAVLVNADPATREVARMSLSCIVRTLPN